MLLSIGLGLVAVGIGALAFEALAVSLACFGVAAIMIRVS